MTMLEKTLMQAEMFKLGIIPLDGTSCDINMIMKSYPIDEQRKMKRKFRKIWRKFVKQLRAKETSKKLIYHCNRPGEVPSKAMKVQRKELIFKTVYFNKVVPIIVTVNESLNKKGYGVI